MIRDVVELLPAGRAHRGFIFSTFADSLRSNMTEDVRGAVARLERQMNGGLGHIAVARVRGAEEELLGWAATESGALVYAYVISGARRQGIAAHMVTSLLDVVPVPLRYWSRSAQAISLHGWPLVYAPFDRPRRKAAA